MNRLAARLFSLTALAALIACTPRTALAIDPAHRDRAVAMATKATAFLKSKQHETGGWNVPALNTEDPAKTSPHFPGVTALVLSGMLLDPSVKHDDYTITAGAKYLLNWQQSDGGIYDRVLPSYNTSLAVSALSKVRQPWATEAVEPAVRFLKQLQWSEASDPGVGGDESPKPVPPEHPFYGGIGYGRHARPDGSNLNIFMQAMQDAGVPHDDPAIQRAIKFLERTQMLDETNDMPYADGSRQGGFIYATVPNGESVDGRAGQSFAGTTEETLSDGTVASRLRAYGSMTYAGFKSYVYARLKRDDPRVTAALNWIRDHYTVRENPGVGTDGFYYYTVTFARALGAWGQPTLDVRIAAAEKPDENAGKKSDTDTDTGADNRPADRPVAAVATRDWANDLIDRLAELQNDDGSFKSIDDRWMENDPVLITAYALIALRTAVNESKMVGK